ncbi:MAG: hypothetical protein U0704_13140 [Candidatus Eisenbacteria bacterium]
MKPTLKKFRTQHAALALAVAGALAGSLVAADADARHYVADTWADGRLVDVQVRVEGSAAPLYFSPNGDDRRYVQAFAGRNYSLVVRNNSNERVAVLLAVDGLNVINGERTRLSSNEQMYVLSPYETATIRGWRTSLDEVRKFVFVDEERSYAERTGQANRDMGWIRVLSFREQRRWWTPRPDMRFKGEAERREAQDDLGERAPQAAPAPSTEAAPPARGEAGPMAKGVAPQMSNESVPGTGWGERSTDRIGTTQFLAERNATDQIIVRYEYASGLRALGIDVRPSRVYERDRGELGFAKPPRW